MIAIWPSVVRGPRMPVSARYSATGLRYLFKNLQKLAEVAAGVDMDRNVQFFRRRDASL